MRPAKIHILLCVVLLVCGCAEPPPPVRSMPRVEEGIRLRYAYVPGQATCYLFRSSFSSQTPGSPDAVISVSQEVEISRTIEASFPDGSARVRLVVERFKAVTSSPGQSVEFDTAQDPEGEHCPTELRGMAALVGKGIELTQSATGEVQAVAGLTTIYRQAVNSLSQTELQSLEHFLRELSHKPRGLFGMGAILPREPMVPGRQWVADRGPFPLFCGQRVYPCRYEFHGVSGEMATIAFAENSGEAHETEEARWKPLWTKGIRGDISFDIEKGLLSHTRGESTTYLRVAEKMEMRSKVSWDLAVLNCSPVTTNSTAESSPGAESRK